LLEPTWQPEQRNFAEARRMLAIAQTCHADAQLSALSLHGCFTSAYNAANNRVDTE
jgi:hypothetical protein